MMVSIIIPVYRVEKYLARCIDSVISQTYTNLEIILVDDGSTDLSGKICDEYRKKDRRIIVIHQENAGASNARNRALDIMSGDAVVFVDADDFIDVGHIETLVNLINRTEADIAISSYVKSSAENAVVFSKSKNTDEALYTGEEACIRMLLAKDIDSCVCCKLVKKEILGKSRFRNDMTIGEDLEFYYRVLRKAKKVAYSNKKEYAYIQHMTNTINILTSEAMNSLKEIEKLIINEENKSLKNALTSKCVSTYFHFLLLENDREKQKYLKTSINKYRRNLIFSKEVALKVRVACLVSFVSYKFFL